MKNYIGIDSSKNSTAIAIESNKGHFLFNYTTHEAKYKWIRLTTDFINFRFFKYEEVENYSENEIIKMNVFKQIADSILADIINSIDVNEQTIVAMEGYNYNLSSVSYIIDLVAIGTLIRIKIMENIKVEKFIILAPKNVKTSICELVYGKPEPKLGKKGQPLKEIQVSRNNLGIAGGSFEKCDMFNAILDGNIYSPILDFCTTYKNELISGTSVKKPFEDVNDAIIIKELSKKV